MLLKPPSRSFLTAAQANEDLRCWAHLSYNVSLSLPNDPERRGEHFSFLSGKTENWLSAWRRTDFEIGNMVMAKEQGRRTYRGVRRTEVAVKRLHHIQMGKKQEPASALMGRWPEMQGKNQRAVGSWELRGERDIEEAWSPGSVEPGEPKKIRP